MKNKEIWKEKYVLLYRNLKAVSKTRFEAEKNFSILTKYFCQKHWKLKKIVHLKFIDNKDSLKIWTLKPTFAKNMFISGDLTETQENSLLLNKPIWFFLELSTVRMYDYHHSYILKKCNAQLLFTATFTATTIYFLTFMLLLAIFKTAFAIFIKSTLFYKNISLWTDHVCLKNGSEENGRLRFQVSVT